MNKNNNKLIAEFMGVERTYNPSTEKVLSYAVTNDVQCLPHELQYHTSWDWLMPVVSKINSIAHAEELYDVGEYELLTDYLVGANIDTSYTHVVEFIKWYNNFLELPKE